jgi:hypothetical protein
MATFSAKEVRVKIITHTSVECLAGLYLITVGIDLSFSVASSQISAVSNQTM